MRIQRRSSDRHLSIASRATGLLLATASLGAIQTAQAQSVQAQSVQAQSVQAQSVQAQSAQAESPRSPAEQANQFQQDAASVKGRTQKTEAPESRATGDTSSSEDVIVTGVSTATNARKANVSYSVLNEDDMSKFTPISADDMLRDMPGVVVESNDGVARNEVFTRGMTIGTGSNTSGYFWSTVLEDGLPTVPFKFGGFQDGYFYRADIGTARVEAVRGGSSAIGVSTSVGAAFNYITGMPKPGVAAQIRIGFEGESTHLSWRQADVAVGWQNKNKDFGLGISGFYRTSNGQVDPGYNLNEGGQIRVNVRKEYVSDNGGGAFNIIFKHLDDTNAELTTFQQPAYGYQSPQDFPGFGRDVNLFLAGGQQTVPNSFRDGTHTLTPQDGYRYKQDALSLSWSHSFDNGLSFNAAMRFQKSSARGQQYKTGGIQSLGSSVTLRERLGANIANIDRTPGFYEVYNDAGTVVARVANNVAGSQLGVDYRTGLACPRVTATTFQTNPSSLCVTQNNLPNANLDLRGGTVTGTIQNTAAAVIAQFGPFTTADLPTSAAASRDLVLLTQTEDTYRSSKDFSGVFSMNYKTESLNYNFSIYAAHAQQVSEAWSNGRGISAYANDQVRNLGVRYVTNTGTTYQLTDAAGWGYYGTGAFGTYTRNASITEFSPFTTLAYSPDEHWDFNAGIKYQYIRASTYSENWNIRNPNAINATFGGLDGNPLTVYDNLYNVINPAQVIRASRDVSTFNYSAAVGYNFNRDHKVYVRWTDAKNAAAGIVERYQNVATLARPLGPTAFVRGIEAAYSFNTPRVQRPDHLFPSEIFGQRFSDRNRCRQHHDVSAARYRPNLHYRRGRGVGEVQDRAQARMDAVGDLCRRQDPQGPCLSEHRCEWPGACGRHPAHRFRHPGADAEVDDQQRRFVQDRRLPLQRASSLDGSPQAEREHARHAISADAGQPRSVRSVRGVEEHAYHVRRSQRVGYAVYLGL